MEIFELAASLGKVLKEDARLVALEEAKKAYESDEKLRRSMVEYEVQQKAMQQEVLKPEKDLQFLELIQKRIDELYKEITENPVFAELDRAQAEVNALMNRVNAAIMFEITGETQEGGCTHDCSTCGGCH